MDCKRHIIKHYLIPFAYPEFTRTLTRATSWDDVLRNISEQQRVLSYDRCKIVPTAISFSNEHKSIRYFLHLQEGFTKTDEQSTLKETLANEDYLRARELADSFEGDGDDLKRAADVAKVAVAAASEMASVQRSVVYNNKKKLLKKWKHSLSTYADREFEKLVTVLFPVPMLQNELCDSDEAEGLETNGTGSNMANEGAVDATTEQSPSQQQEENGEEETQSKRKRHSSDDDEDSEDDDDSRGPAAFDLDNLRGYKSKPLRTLMDEIDPLTSVLQEDCMSSKNYDCSSYLPLIISILFSRRLLTKQVVWFSKSFGLYNVCNRECIPTLQNLLYQ